MIRLALLAALLAAPAHAGPAVVARPAIVPVRPVVVAPRPVPPAAAVKAPTVPPQPSAARPAAPIHQPSTSWSWLPLWLLWSQQDEKERD